LAQVVLPVLGRRRPAQSLERVDVEARKLLALLRRGELLDGCARTSSGVSVGRRGDGDDEMSRRTRELMPELAVPVGQGRERAPRVDTPVVVGLVVVVRFCGRRDRVLVRMADGCERRA